MAHAHGQCVARKVLRLKQCTTDGRLADCLTKPLGRLSFFKPSICSNTATKEQGSVEDNQNNRNDPSPSASSEAFLEDHQRVTYTYTVSADGIILLRV
jgi:hypothetical protein